MPYNVIKEKYYKKPDGTYESVGKYGANAEDVDRTNGETVETSLTALETNKLDKAGDGKDVTVSFLESGERSELMTDDTLSTLFGKIKRNFSDLKTVAFTAKAADIEEDDEHKYTTVVEKQGWNNKVNSVDGDISNTKIVTSENISEEFPIPTAGDTGKGFLGKVKKFCTDFNSFKTGIITLGKLVNNGQCTEPGFALDARYGKTLAEQVAQLNSNLAAEFTAAVVQDLNSPTMAIHSYLNNANNPPNGYQTGGKVISVMDSNGELGAQLSLTRGYSHPQYRYKDNNGWSAWNNILLESDQKTIQVGSDHAVTDCNNVMPGQMAYVYANAAHAPSGNKSWNVWCTGLDAFRMQIAINVTTNVPIMMIRSSHTGVWSDWVEK